MNTFCDFQENFFGYRVCKNYVAINRCINMCAIISGSIQNSDNVYALGFCHTEFII